MSRIIDDAREKIADIVWKQVMTLLGGDSEALEEIDTSKFAYGKVAAGKILAISGTTDIECPECDGKRFSDNIPNGNSTPCNRCFGKGNIGEHKWKIAVVLENGELPKDELAEMVIRQTEIVGMEGAKHPYYQAQQDMLNEGWVKEVRQVVE